MAQQGRRTVTALFADAVESTSFGESHDEEVVFELMRACVQRMSETVQRHGGVVTQFLGDGIIALFGAPTAFEGSARHAVAAALEMQSSLAEYATAAARDRGVSYEFRVGLNTGPAVVGQISDDETLGFTALGDTVNVAARVQDLAEPGTVCVTEATHRLVADYFECVALGAYVLKGRSTEVNVFRAVAPTAVRNRFEAAIARGLAPLVGRDAELEVLQDCWDTVAAGRGQVVVLSGEAGMGKSRLLLELRGRVPDGCPWLDGRCNSLTTATPYLPMIELVKGVLALPETAPEDDVSAALDELAYGWPEPARAALPYLRWLLQVDPGDPRISALHPQERRAGILDALRTFVMQIASAGPAVIVVEDLHWLDERSADAIRVVVEAANMLPVLVVLTHRTGTELSRWGGLDSTRLELSGLSGDAVERLACSVAQTSDLPTGLVEQLVAKGDGSPFYVEEVMRSLVETGLVRNTHAQSELVAALADTAVPSTVQEVVVARIDRLTPAERESLQLAAVVGREFGLGLLERVQHSTGTLAATLDVLQRLEFIVETATTPDVAYMFKHAVVHEVAYSTLLHSERRQMHHAIGEAIEDLQGDRVGDHVETLARHFTQAEDWAKALDYTIKAGEKAAAAFANKDALDAYAAALDLCVRLEEPPMRVTLVALSRGLVNINIGDWAAAGRDFRVMLESCSTDARFGPLALGLRGLSEQFEHKYEEAERSFRAVLDATAGGGSDDVRLLAAGQLTLLLRVTDRFDEAKAPEREAERLMTVAHDPLFRSWWGWIAAVQAGWTGDFDGAIAKACEARRIATESDVMTMTLFSVWAEGLARAGRGQYQRALHVLRIGLAECKRVGDTQVEARILNTLGWVYGEVENHREANDWNRCAAEVASSGTDANSAELETYSRLNLGESLLALGDLDAAAEQFAQLEHRSRNPRVEDRWMHWRWSQHLFASYGELHLRAGRPDRALSYLDECLELADRSDSKKYVAKGRRLRAEALLSLGRRADARRDIDIACTAADTIGNPAQQWKAHAVRADVLQAHGEVDLAHHERKAAMDIVEDTARGLDDDEVRATFLASDQVTKLRTALARWPTG